MKSYKNMEVFLWVSCLILFFAHLGKLYVDIMEARNFVSVREMVKEGHWIFTTMNDVPRYEKPPLPTWFSAFMAEIFGTKNIWALRFPAALSAFFSVVFFKKIVRFLTNNNYLSTISSLILASMFLVIYVGRRGNWDIFSYSFMVIGLYFFLLALKEIKTYPNYLFAGFWFGLSLLSKGPTGPYVLLIPFFLAYIIVNGFPKWKTIFGIAFCAVITVLIGFSWYVYIYSADPETFLAIMEKEATARGNRDVKPFTRYLSFPVQTGVWVFFSVLGLIFPFLKKKLKAEEYKDYRIFLLWTLFSLILLSLIPSKKERYLFPLMIPLAATTGYYSYTIIRYMFIKRWEYQLNKVIFAFLGSLCIILGIGIFFVPVEKGLYTYLFSLTMLAVGIFILIVDLKQKSFIKSFLGVVLMMNCAVLFGTPILDKMLFNNKDYKSLQEAKPLIEKSGLKLYSFKEYSPEVWFSYHEIMPEINLENPQSFPKEKEFYIASNSEGEHHAEYFKNLGWEIEFIGKYDDNETAAPSKNNTGRKYHYLYKVKKN